MMDKYISANKEAQKRIRIADHMLTMTYPLVQDTKLLLVVLENIFSGMSYAMESLLYFERKFRRIPPIGSSFESQLALLKKCAFKYGISKDYLLLIQEVQEILLARKMAPIEFVKNDTFVICSENYSMRTISFDKIRQYLGNAKLFIEEIGDIIQKNENLNRTSYR